MAMTWEEQNRSYFASDHILSYFLWVSIGHPVKGGDASHLCESVNGFSAALCYVVTWPRSERGALSQPCKKLPPPMYLFLSLSMLPLHNKTHVIYFLGLLLPDTSGILLGWFSLGKAFLLDTNKLSSGFSQAKANRRMKKVPVDQRRKTFSFPFEYGGFTVTSVCSYLTRPKEVITVCALGLSPHSLNDSSKDFRSRQ